MAVTREERMWEAMLNDAPEQIPTAVTRKERMLKKLVKQACDNDTFSGGGGGMPEGGEPNQQLVTDGAGNVGWADRLAYENQVWSYYDWTMSEWMDSLDEVSKYIGTLVFDQNYLHLYDGMNVLDYTSVGKQYVVTFDGVDYATKKKNLLNSEGEPSGATYIGNGYLINAEQADSGEPFAFKIDADEYYETAYVAEIGTHTIGLKKSAGTTVQTIDPKYLPKAESVADAAGDTPTATEFNALLASLRTAGYLSE